VLTRTESNFLPVVIVTKNCHLPSIKCYQLCLLPGKW